MAELELLCARPHVKDVDFRTSRFVVCRSSGIDVAVSPKEVRHLEEGEEVPLGSLNEEALRQLYGLTQHAIETFEYAATQPWLREACARKGVVLGETGTPERLQAKSASASPAPSPDLDSLDARQLRDLCYRKGLRTNGNQQQLRQRLASHLG